jgi:hypothetical protein
MHFAKVPKVGVAVLDALRTSKVDWSHWTDAESASSVWLTQSLSQSQTDTKSRSRVTTNAKSRSCLALVVRCRGVFMLRGDWRLIWWTVLKKGFRWCVEDEE